MFFAIFLSFLSALFLIFSFPMPDFSWLAWIGFLPLFFALQNKSKKQAFWISYLWGLFFWAGLLYWLVNVTFLGYVFLVLYLAIYFGIFGLIVSTVNCKLLIVNWLIIPCLWVSLEYLRSNLFTGFGWALLGYSQYKNIPLIQIADITGAYGVSFLIVLINVTIFKFVNICSKRKSIVPSAWCLVPFFCAALCFLYGHIRLHQPLLPRKELRISLIQSNISPYEKWDGRLKDLIIEKYKLLSEAAAKEAPDLIIWPETSFPGFWEEERDLREKVLELAGELKTNLLIGAPTLEDNLTYNCAILISSQREEIKRYRKIHLVPFGEYVPFPKILGFLENRFAIGDYTRGDKYVIFQIRNPKFETRNKFPFPNPESQTSEDKFSVLICFEAIFPNLVRRFVQEGAEFLINITEDGWYGAPGASFQHMQAAVFRAVENKRFLVRAANAGYSCVIDNFGKIISDLKDKDGNNLFVTGIHTEQIIPGTCKTFYSQWGDIFAFICIVISCGYLGCLGIDRKAKAKI